MGALEDRIAAAEAKLKQLKAEQQRIETRKKATAVKRRRQDDTRRKILAGAVLLAQVESGEWPEAKFKAMMDKGLTRDEDRELFALPLSEEPKDQKPQKANSASNETVS